MIKINNKKFLKENEFQTVKDPETGYKNLERPLSGNMILGYHRQRDKFYVRSSDEVGKTFITLKNRKAFKNLIFAFS